MDRQRTQHTAQKHFTGNNESIFNILDSDRIPETRVVTRCETIIPDREQWNSGTLVQMPPGNCCYTDGSRLGGKTGLGLFIEEPDTEISLRLTDHSTILQAEVQAITECLNWLVSNQRQNTVNIITDSKQAINAISSRIVKSKTVLKCIKTINDFAQQGPVRIIWVPGHQGIIGNEVANQLARSDTALPNRLTTVSFANNRHRSTHSIVVSFAVHCFFILGTVTVLYIVL